MAKLRRRDFYDVGDQFCLRFQEKVGKVREIPVRHDLQTSLYDYLEDSGLRFADPSSPLFRTTIRRTNRLTLNPLSAERDIGADAEDATPALTVALEDEDAHVRDGAASALLSITFRVDAAL